MGLTSEELTQFDELGYVGKEIIYNDADLQLLKDGLTAAIHERCLELITEGKLDRDFAEESFETRLTKICRHTPDAGHEVLMAIWSGRFHGPGMLTALRHSPLLDCIEDLTGPEIVAASIYRVRPKVPGHTQGEVPWHQDSGYSAPHCDNYTLITCWIPLVDSTLENGCLWVIPKVHQAGIIQHYSQGHANYLEIAPEEVPEGALALEMKAGSAVFMTSFTPHASFDNGSDIVRWSIDLRYQNSDVPNNLDELPEDYTPERDPITMACNPGEAYFVIRDPEHPERELRDPEEFAALRERWEGAGVRGPGRGWTPLAEREIR